MPQSYVMDPSALAQIVQRGLMGGAELRQNRDAMTIRQAEAEQRRQRELAQQQLQQDRFGLDQQQFAAAQQQQELANALNMAQNTRADAYLGLNIQENQQKVQQAEEERRALAADVLDKMQQTGQVPPGQEGRVWKMGTKALASLNARLDKAIESGKSTASIKREARDLYDSGFVELMKDPAQREWVTALAKNADTPEELALLRSASQEVWKMRAEAEDARQKREQQQALQQQVGELIQKKRAGMALTPQEEGMLARDANVSQYEVQNPKPFDAGVFDEEAVKRANAHIGVLKNRLEALVGQAKQSGLIDQHGKIDTGVSGEGSGGWFSDETPQHKERAALLKQIADLQTEIASTTPDKFKSVPGGTMTTGQQAPSFGSGADPNRQAKVQFIARFKQQNPGATKEQIAAALAAAGL